MILPRAWLFVQVIFFVLLLSSCNSVLQRQSDIQLVNHDILGYLQNVDESFYEAYLQIVHFEDYEGAAQMLRSKIEDARNRQELTQLRKFYTAYFLLPDLSLYHPESESYASHASGLAFNEGSFKDRWNLNYALFRYYHSKRNANEAQNYAITLSNLAGESNTPSTMALSSLALGLAFDLKGNSRSAVRYLFNALFYAERSNSDKVRVSVLSEISHFYRNKQMLQNAMEYKKRELSLRPLKTAIDSLDYFHAELYFHDIVSLSHPERLFDTARVYQIIDIAKAKPFKHLLHYTTSFLRTTFADGNFQHELAAYYTGRGKDELEVLKERYPHLYYRVIASIAEVSNDFSKAEENYHKAKNALGGDIHVNARLSHFYMNFGRFYLRQQNQQAAIENFKKSFEYAKLSNLDLFARDAAFQLKSQLLELGEYEEATAFIIAYHELNEQLLASTRDQEVFKIEAQAEQKILEENLIREQAQIDAIHQSQFNLIAVIVFIGFIGFLSTVHFKVPVWVVKAMGFISFIFFFEFIVIYSDRMTRAFINDLPLKIFFVQVLIIIVLLPMHHFLEKRSVKYILRMRQAEKPLFNLNFKPFKEWFKRMNLPD